MFKPKYLIIFILSIAMSINVYGLFVLNETCDAFDPNPCDDDLKESGYVPLGQLIEAGAGYFLKSNSNYQLLLEKVELSGSSGVDAEELFKIIDDAVYQMELANETYYQMLQVTNNLSYDAAVQEKLMNFDYSGYQAAQRLIPSIFSNVVKLLKAGNVRGCYYYIYTRTLEILSRLKALRAGLEVNPLPDIPACWRLNQVYQETGLYGQYITEVFMNMK